MAGYWPSSFLHFMDRDEVEVHKNAKKRTRLISSHLDQTSLVNKGFIIWPKGYTTEVSPSTRRLMCPLVIFKIKRSKLIFVHLTLSNPCNDQCFINCFIL